MSGKKYAPKSFDGYIISRQAIEKLIKNGDGAAALLYLFLLKNGGDVSASNAALNLKMDPAQAESALNDLVSMGLIASKDAPQEPELIDETPNYTADDIQNELKNGSEFPALTGEVQRCLGKVLSSDDLMRLFGIYDGLRLPSEVILLLVNHCVNDFKVRYDGRRLPTMRYIEKAAYSWERDGICTMELAEEHIKNMDNLRSREGVIKSALNIGSRPLTASERKYIDGWINMGFPTETIEAAYDRTVLRTGKLTWKYMDSILKNWKSKNITTVSDIAEKDGDGAPTRKAAGNSATAEDVSRMQRLIRKMNEQEDR